MARSSATDPAKRGTALRLRKRSVTPKKNTVKVFEFPYRFTQSAMAGACGPPYIHGS
jgi:hypothetical protein